MKEVANRLLRVESRVHMLVRTFLAVELEEDTITGANTEVQRHAVVWTRSHSCTLVKKLEPKWNIGTEVVWAAVPYTRRESDDAPI